jgi:hypothetical protein
MTPVDKLALIRRRTLLKATVAGSFAATPVGSLGASKLPVVSLSDFGVKGDGQADDGDAFKAALASAQVVEIPPGRFRIGSPLILRDGQVVRGVGRSGWEPYKGSGPPQSAVKTEIIVDGLAIDARGTNNAGVADLAIRASRARQSEWGQPAGHQAGTIGVDIAGSKHFDANGVSFHGLEAGISCTAQSGDPAQMPRLSDWVAEDCAAAIRFVSDNPDFYSVRDARIEGCLAALHCNRIVEARRCDGLRIENVRFFQCHDTSVYIEDSPFVTITGATLFETGQDSMVLRGCKSAAISGVQIIRAGFFHAGKLIQRTAARFEKCDALVFQGIIEESVGRAMSIHDCTNVCASGVIANPYWSTGSPTSDDGAVRIERSSEVMLNASFSGETYWIALWADAASAPSLGGQIVTSGTAGVVRGVPLLPSGSGHVARTTAEIKLEPNASIHLDVLRQFVPQARSLYSCSVELTAGNLEFEAAGQRWAMQGGELDGGSISTERKLLHRNDSDQPHYVSIPIGVHNPTSQPIRIPAGLEVRTAMVLT